MRVSRVLKNVRPKLQKSKLFFALKSEIWALQRTMKTGVGLGPHFTQYSLVSSARTGQRKDLGGTQFRKGFDETLLLKVLKILTGVFSTEGSQLGNCSLVEHSLNTGAAKPIKEPIRRFNLWQQAETATQRRDWLNLGVIHHAKVNGPWTCSILSTATSGSPLSICFLGTTTLWQQSRIGTK